MQTSTPFALVVYCTSLAAQLVPAAPEALAGNSGWVGTGLLGAVLGWFLFKYLPGKDAQLSSIIATKDAQITALVGSHEKNLRETRDDFKDALQRVTDHCRDKMVSLTDTLRREFDALRQIKAGAGPADKE